MGPRAVALAALRPHANLVVGILCQTAQPGRRSGAREGVVAPRRVARPPVLHVIVGDGRPIVGRSRPARFQPGRVRRPADDRRLGHARGRHVGHVDRESQRVGVSVPVVHGDGQAVVGGLDLVIQRFLDRQLAGGRVQREHGGIGPAKSEFQRIVLGVRRRERQADGRARRRVLGDGTGGRIAFVEYGWRVVVRDGHARHSPAHRNLAGRLVRDLGLAQDDLEALRLLVLFVVEDGYLDGRFGLSGREGDRTGGGFVFVQRLRGQHGRGRRPARL